ncbi:MFS allantoate transporter-like protein [Xylogone sp. PMI_703]|nr:MFS allantoate transporter-like protein [Xylogone sp. PMI_703]
MANDEQKTLGARNINANAKRLDHDIELRENVDQVTIDHREALSPSSTLPAWKSIVNQTDGDTALALFENVEQLNEVVDTLEEKKLVRKIDLLILPCLIVCYTFYYVDKTTLSYAAIFGIRQDLNLVGTEYSWLSSVFYFGWLAWAFPTNYMLQRFPLAKYLAINIFLWGALLMCQAAAQNFTQLAVLRVLSGGAEGCSDSAFMLITTMWYTRREQPIRVGIWYTANGLGNAVGGLLGYGIGHIRGNLPSWKYEFLIVGALCCVWGIVLFIILPDSPVTARFLSHNEKRTAVERLRENQTGVENKHFKLYQVKEAFSDYKTLLFFFIATFANIPNGGISNFGTLIIQGFGFSTLVTTIMAIPYGAIIIISILTCVLINDRLPPNNRYLMAILFLLPSFAGALGLRFLSSDHKVGLLIMYYLTGTNQAAFVLILSILTGNTAGHTKKVITSATLFVGVCVGNIGGPFFYKTNQAPEYRLGIGSMIVGYAVEIGLVFLLGTLLKRENKKRDAIQGIDPSSGESEARRDLLYATAFNDMTDRENLNFRYVY